MGGGAGGHARRLGGECVLAPGGEAVLVVDQFAHVVAYGVEARVALEEGAQQAEEIVAGQFLALGSAGIVAQQVGGEGEGLVQDLGKIGVRFPRAPLQGLHPFVEGFQIDFIHLSSLLNGFLACSI